MTWLGERRKQLPSRRLFDLVIPDKALRWDWLTNDDGVYLLVQWNVPLWESHPWHVEKPPAWALKR